MTNRTHLLLILTLGALASCSPHKVDSEYIVQVNKGYAPPPVTVNGVAIPRNLDCGSGHDVRDLYIEDVPGSKSYWLGPWVKTSEYAGVTIYTIQGYNRFYVETSSLLHSTRQFYGPFKGSPASVFGS